MLSLCFSKSTEMKLFLVQRHFSGARNSKKDMRMLKMIPCGEDLPPVEPKPMLRFRGGAWR